MKKIIVFVILNLLIGVSMTLADQIGGEDYPVGTYGVFDGEKWTPLADQSDPAASIVNEKRLGTRRRSSMNVIGSYDFYSAASYGPNYTDAHGLSLGVEWPLFGQFYGRAEAIHITDVEFPEPRDPKGAWGELRGLGGMGSVVYKLPFNDRLTFDIAAGAGLIGWDFRENPFLQDRAVKVDVDPALALRAGIGAAYKVNNDWELWSSFSWFDTDIKKSITENEFGIQNILDSGDEIGLQYRVIRLGFTKRT